MLNVAVRAKKLDDVTSRFLARHLDVVGLEELVSLVYAAAPISYYQEVTRHEGVRYL